jgi:hypothetical protein
LLRVAEVGSPFLGLSRWVDTDTLCQADRATAAARLRCGKLVLAVWAQRAAAPGATNFALSRQSGQRGENAVRCVDDVSAHHVKPTSFDTGAGGATTVAEQASEPTSWRGGGSEFMLVLLVSAPQPDRA